VAYCPGCSNRELVIQALTDLWRLRNATPLGFATATGDYLLRNSGLEEKVEEGFRDTREWLDNYETIFTAGETDRGANSRSGPGAARPGRMNVPLEATKIKKKRKVSRYQREFGRQLKALKKKHPRTPVTRLMKKAHRATKKALK